MEIRVIDGENAAELKQALGLVRDVFWDFEAPEYSDEGILEFEHYIELESIAGEMAQNRLLIWGAFVRGRAVGVIAVRPPCHISLFFVEKRYHRKGIGKALYGVISDYFRGAPGCEAFTVNSSPYAVPVYQRLGFTETGPEETVNGIRFIPMRSELK